MPKVTEAHLEARRQQILDAAFACFARQGFHQTTMQDICREADLSPGAMYRYFPGKEAIIAASCEHCYQQHIALMDAVEARSADTLDVLDQLVDSDFGELDRPEAHHHMCMNVQLWSEALRSPDIMEAFRRANFDALRQGLTQIVRRAKKRGEIDPSLHAESVARVLLATWYGLMLQKAFDPELDVGRYVSVVKALYGGTFWRGQPRDDARRRDAPVTGERSKSNESPTPQRQVSS